MRDTMAFRELLPLAEQGDAAAQHKLGVMYYSGEGVPQDKAEGLKWYRKAAKQDHEGAKGMLRFLKKVDIPKSSRRP